MERDGQSEQFQQFLQGNLKYAQIGAGKKFAFEFVLRIYSVLGLLIAVAATASFIFTLVDFNLTTEQQLSLVLAGVGIALSIMSRLLLVIRRQREEYTDAKVKELLYTSELIECWKNFEDVGRTVIGKSEQGTYSLRSIITQLRQKNEISETDVSTLQAALILRNLAVHGRGRVSPDLIVKVISEVSDIVAKLSKQAAVAKRRYS